MKSYKKKPIVIQAEHLTLEHLNNRFDKLSRSVTRIITVIGDKRVYYKRNFLNSIDNKYKIDLNNPYSIEVETLEGLMKGNIGDYLIIGVEGEPYICREDIFEKTYEQVD